MFNTIFQSYILSIRNSSIIENKRSMIFELLQLTKFKQTLKVKDKTKIVQIANNNS